MLVHKSNGVAFVFDYNEKNETDQKELEKLNKQFGENRVLHRHYMVQEYLMTKDGKEQTFQIPFFNNIGLNRHERRQREKTSQYPFYGLQKDNQQARTKHMRTCAEIQWERAGRKRV